MVVAVSTLHSGSLLDFRESDKLPIELEFSSLGRGLSKVKDRERDRHVELVRWALNEMSWNADDFDVYRFRLQYPPLSLGVAFDWQRRSALD